MTVLQSLARLHGRLESNGRAPSYGFSRENISFVVVLSRRGEPVDVQDVRDTSSKTPRPRRIVVPRPVKRTGQPAPNFLWDKTAFSLGVKRDDGANHPVPALREHTAFKECHRRLLADVDDEAIRAFLLFLNGWRADDYERLRYAQEMLNVNIAFRLDWEEAFLHERSAAEAVWLNHLANEEGAGGLCLVTGEHAPIVRLHPSVKGVAGAQGSGASIVSFEKDAFQVVRQGTGRQCSGVGTSRVRLHRSPQHAARTQQPAAHPHRGHDDSILGRIGWRPIGRRTSRRALLDPRGSADRRRKGRRGGGQARLGRAREASRRSQP